MGTSDNPGQFYVVRGKEKDRIELMGSRMAAAATAASRSEGELGVQC